MSVVERLRRNDPTTRSIRINLHDEPSDSDLALALQQNPFITEINLRLRNVQTTDWNSLLRVIAMQANLEKVTLRDAYRAEHRNAPAALVGSILRAIQQNTAIRAVDLTQLRLPTDISTFVETASSITYFCLWSCDMGPVEREQGARDLAAAMQRNTNIKTLELGNLDEVCMSSIVPGLRSNISLKFLSLGGTSFSDATTPAIQQLLESTVSIKTFGLGGLSFENNGDMLRTIAQSLIQSRIVSELTFASCKFRDEESAAHFQSILRDKHNLTSLCLTRCQFQGGQVHETIISTLSLPESPLRCFASDTAVWSRRGRTGRKSIPNLKSACSTPKLPSKPPRITRRNKQGSVCATRHLCEVSWGCKIQVQLKETVRTKNGLPTSETKKKIRSTAVVKGHQCASSNFSRK